MTNLHDRSNAALVVVDVQNDRIASVVDAADVVFEDRAGTS